MSNELIWLCLLAVDFLGVVLAAYFFGKAGLYGMIVVEIIVCNLQTLKLVELFGFETTLGNIAYGGVYLCTDLLSEVYGRREAEIGVWLGLFMLVFITCASTLTLWFEPHPQDFAHVHMVEIFSRAPRIILASFVAFFLSQFHDVWTFHWLKEKTSHRHLWLRNNSATILSQVIDTAVFVVIAFWGVYPAATCWDIFLVAMIFKVFIALLDTPFVYWGRHVLLRNRGSLTGRR